MSKSIFLLCASDIHLGRRPSRLPSEVDSALFSPKKAWEDLIQTAIDKRVDALLLSGDILDKESDWIESLLPLQTAFTRLKEEKIPVLITAGNHDAHILPKVIEGLSIEGVTLLGKGGVWESKTLIIKGKEIRFDGWSFPSSSYEENPLSSYNLPALKDGQIAIGLLHGDANGSKESCYAPFPLQDFKKFFHKMWVLGHIHDPKILLKDPLVFYPGSLQPLDPTEVGSHGAYLVEIDGVELVSEKISLAKLSYERFSFSLEGVARDNWHRELISKLSSSVSFQSHAELVVLRLILEGRHEEFQKIESFFESLEKKVLLSHPEKNQLIAIDKVYNSVKPDLALDDLKKGQDFLSFYLNELSDIQSDPSLILKLKEVLERAKNENSYFRDCTITVNEMTKLIDEVGLWTVDLLVSDKEERR